MKFKKVKVVILESNHKAENKLILDVVFNTLKIVTRNNSGNKIFDTNIYDDNYKFQDLYFFIDDKIKEGDWYLNFDIYGKCGPPIKANYERTNEFSSKPYSNYCKKIIATTDLNLGVVKYTQGGNVINAGIPVKYPQPSKLFLNKYIEMYNKDTPILECLIEYEVRTDFKDMADAIDGPAYKLKINSKNEIIIKKQKDSFIRKEVIEFAEKYARMVQEKPIQLNAYKTIHNIKWIENNL